MPEPDRYPPPRTRLLDTSIGSVVVTVNLENEYLWAVVFDETGEPETETSIESLIDVEAGWATALKELGLSEGEARTYARHWSPLPRERLRSG